MPKPPQLVLLDYQYPTTGVGDSVYLDASVHEQHVTTAEVTTHAVETGSAIADFIRPLPRKLTIEGMITNTPIMGELHPSIIKARKGFKTDASPTDVGGGQAGTIQTAPVGGGQPGNFSALKFSTEYDRVIAAYDSLVAACRGGALFAITTSLTTYQSDIGDRNMACVNFAVPRDVDHANAIMFTADFQEVRIVNSQQTTVQQPGAKQKLGQQPTRQLDPVADAQLLSLAYKAAH